MSWRIWCAGLVVGLSLFVVAGTSRGGIDLPTRLSDDTFWRLVTQFSESNGYFDSDNLVSNEDTFQAVIPALTDVVPAGGVYLGVGPDQNFTYILAV